MASFENLSSVDELRAYAIHLDNEGKHEESIIVFEKALILEPNNMRVKAEMADSYQSLGEIDRALQMYKEVLEINPYQPLALNNYAGIVYERAFSSQTEENIGRLDYVVTLLSNYLATRNIPRSRLPADEENFEEMHYENSQMNYEVVKKLLKGFKRVLKADLGGESTTSLKQCSVCHAPQKFICSQCRSVCYCSKECQKIDWKTHKYQCKVQSTPSSKKSTTKPLLKAHTSFWGCSECGTECTCQNIYTGVREFHTMECHHTMNSLRRKGPECWGMHPCEWFCCNNKELDSFCFM